MLNTHYVGLDIHKKSISYCIRQADGTIQEEGQVVANRQALDGVFNCLRLVLAFFQTLCTPANRYRREYRQLLVIAPRPVHQSAASDTF